jgi:hypothetical protein
VRQVLRIVATTTGERTEIVAHPADLSQSVRVSNLIELLRIK